MCEITYMMNTEIDDSIFTLMKVKLSKRHFRNLTQSKYSQKLETDIMKNPTFKKWARTRRPWQNGDPGERSRYTIASKIFTFKPNDNNQSIEDLIPDDTHAWIESACIESAMYIPNPERPSLYELQGTSLVDLYKSGRPKFDAGDIIWMSFNVAFNIFKGSWASEIIPMELVRVGHLSDELKSHTGLMNVSSYRPSTSGINRLPTGVLVPLYTRMYAIQSSNGTHYSPLIVRGLPEHSTRRPDSEEREAMKQRHRNISQTIRSEKTGMPKHVDDEGEDSGMVVDEETDSDGVAHTNCTDDRTSSEELTYDEDSQEGSSDDEIISQGTSENEFSSQEMTENEITLAEASDDDIGSYRAMDNDIGSTQVSDEEMASHGSDRESASQLDWGQESGAETIEDHTMSQGNGVDVFHVGPAKSGGFSSDSSLTPVTDGVSDEEQQPKIGNSVNVEVASPPNGVFEAPVKSGLRRTPARKAKATMRMRP